MASSKSSLPIVYSVLVIFLTSLASFFLLLPYLPSSRIYDLYHPTQENYNGKHPRNHDLYSFHTIPELEKMSSDGDAAWQQITTARGSGFLWIRHNDTYRVGWGVSMFHALHCLSIVRDVVKQNSHFYSETKDSKNPGGNEHNAHMGYKHVGHCLSYIAQSLLCSADGTIEKPQSLLDGNGDILRDDVNGEDVKHMCRDKGLLLEMIRKSEKRPLDYYPETKDGDTIWDIFE